MRTAVLALLVCVPAARSQTPEVAKATEDKLGTIRYLLAREDPAGGFAPTAGGRPGLRATSAALRALKYHGHKAPHPEKHAAFVMRCFDPRTGGFADAPGGKADVALTAVGVMAAAELGVPKERYRKALDFLQDHARTFEEARIAAAAAEAWGVKDYPYELAPWIDLGKAHLKAGVPDAKDGGAREVGSAVALVLRLGAPVGRQEKAALGDLLGSGQRADGGWGKAGERRSDLETTYRVMRALSLLGARPADRAKLREFVAACRNADGGSAAVPGEPSTVGGTYYAAVVLHWLAELER